MLGFFWQICLSAAKENEDLSRCETWTPCGRVFQSLISPRNEQLTIIVSFLSASPLPNSNFSLRQHTPASLSHSRKKLVPQSFWRLTTPAHRGFIRAHKEHNKCKNKQTRQRARRARNFQRRCQSCCQTEVFQRGICCGASYVKSLSRKGQDNAPSRLPRSRACVSHVRLIPFCSGTIVGVVGSVKQRLKIDVCLFL